MKEYLQIGKEYWSLFIVLINSIGYIYYYFYYKTFDIAIFQYVNFSDLLVYSIEQLILILLIILFLLSIHLVSLKFYYTVILEKIVTKRLRNKHIKKYGKYNEKQAFTIRERFADFNFHHYFIALVFAPLTILIVVAFLPDFAKIRYTIATAGFAYYSYTYMAYTGRRMEKRRMWIAMFFFIYFFTIGFVFTKAISDSRNVIEEETQNKKLSFIYQNKKFAVSDSLRFIGETSTHLFLYSKNENASLIFAKDKIDKLKINLDEKTLRKAKVAIKDK